MTASLYTHIPFCVSKCAYCDFYSVPAVPGDPALARYVDWLLADIGGKIARYGVTAVPSVYVGGGTPSILGTDGIARLLSFVTAGTERASEERPVPVLPDAEITVEANPDTLDEPFLMTCKKHGVTRISIGVQTFNDACRNTVGRPGNGNMTEEKLALLNGIFPGAFSADLMSGLPGQNERVLLTDIERLLKYRPAHVSLYDMIPHGTVSGLLPEDRKAALWITGRDALLNAGYEQYEVSNFSLAARARSAHNIRYWLMQSWIGAGTTASGTVIDDGKCAGIRETDSRVESLDSGTLMRETFLMGFRYCEGPDADLFRRRFHRSVEDTIPASLAKWEKRGVIRKGETKPTQNGLLFLDAFLRDCFAEAPWGTSLGVAVRSSPAGGANP
ncbi:MAG: coproporphyrinogen III oxidase family protein [Spirochaetaceae bacterium]|nr:coproporphyrinogen III oxidase family protein [Spirochaetaceae bacterium]